MQTVKLPWIAGGRINHLTPAVPSRKKNHVLFLLNYFWWKRTFEIRYSMRLITQLEACALFLFWINLVSVFIFWVTFRFWLHLNPLDWAVYCKGLFPLWVALGFSEGITWSCLWLSKQTELLASFTTKRDCQSSHPSHELSLSSLQFHSRPPAVCVPQLHAASEQLQPHAEVIDVLAPTKDTLCVSRVTLALLAPLLHWEFMFCPVSSRIAICLTAELSRNFP